MDLSTRSPINELGQLVVELPFYSYRCSNFVLAKDEGKEYQFISEDDGVRTFNATTVIALLARKRAPLTVRGLLKLNGKDITPQNYLRHWRTVKPIPIEKLLEHSGLAIMADFDIDVPYERSGTWNYHVGDQSPCMKSFAEFEQKYGSRFIQCAATGNHKVSFDLAEPGVSLDAEQFYNNRFWQRGGKRETTMSFRVVVKDPTPSAHPTNTDQVELELF